MRAYSNIKRLITSIGLVCFVAGAILTSGCNEETGCTNQTADNYNPDAVRDDGSCITARDKFLGVYSVLHIHWPDTMLPLPRYMTIAEDELREAEDDVKILNFGLDSITVRALIDKNFITIPTQNLSVRGVPQTFKGSGHIDDEGRLTILYNIWLMNGQLIEEDCVVFCERLDN